MAYDFNGTNQYLRSSSSPVTAMPITISCLVNTDSGGTVFPFVVIANPTDGSRVNIARVNNDWVASSIDAANFGVSSTSSTYVTGQWTHICGVHTSSSLRQVYVDGVGGTSNATALGSFSSFNQVTIGSNHLQSFFTDGRLAEVGIWNAALTNAEIASLARGITCNKIRPQNLVFYAPLIRNLQDTRGGRIITPVNNPTVVAHPRVYA